MKLCEDCRWCKFDREAPGFSTCQHPATRPSGILDYVTGKTRQPSPLLCNSARVHPCGPEGKYWEERETDG